MIAGRARVAFVVCCLAAVLVFPPVGHRVLATGGNNGDDEGRYLLMARDILDRGALFDIQVRGERTWEKPPLLPWMIAAAARLRGRNVTEGTGQAPIAVATVAVVLFTFLLGDRLFGRRIGAWAAVIVLTAYDFFGHSQQILPDMLVLAFVAMAGAAFVQGNLVRSGSRWPMPVFWSAVGFAVFAKGPLGLVPLVAATAWLGIEHGLRSGLRHLWSPLGVGAFSAITLAWVGPFLSLGAGAFAEHTIREDWLTWYLGRMPEPQNLLQIAAVGFLPWTLLLPIAIVSAVWAWRASAAVRFALIWFSTPLLILGLSAHQKDRYALSLYPSAAMIVAWWADTHGSARTLASRVSGWVALVAAAGVAVAVRMPSWWHHSIRPYFIDLSWVTTLPIVAAVLVVGLAMWYGLERGRPRLLIQGTVAGMVILFGYGIWPYTSRHNEIWNFKELAARAELAARVDMWAEVGDVVVFAHRPDWLALDFYTGRSLATLEDFEELNASLARPGCVVIFRTDYWQRYEATLAKRVDMIDEILIGREKMLIVRSRT